MGKPGPLRVIRGRPMIRSSRAPWVSAAPLPFLALAGAVLSGSGTLRAQQVTGLVAEQGSLAPVAGAVVILYRVPGAGEELHPVDTTLTDREGVFGFSLSMPGMYRVQAGYHGFTSPLSSAVEVLGEQDSPELVLFLPSPLLALAFSCDPEEMPGSVVVGTAWDGATGVSLPGARVTARWREGDRAEERYALTDAAGRYVLCGVGHGGLVLLRVGLLGRAGPWTEVQIPRPALVFHDLELHLGDALARDGDVVAELDLVEREGSGGSLRGRLLDWETGEPVEVAVVRVLGAGLEVVTSSDGGFRFSGFEPGRIMLEIEHLAYGVQRLELEVPGGWEVVARLHLPARPIELEGIEVEGVARLARGEAWRRSPTRVSVFYGTELRQAAVRGLTVTDVLRMVPGVRVERGHVTMIRGIQSLTSGPAPVLWIVDGVRSGFIPHLVDIESIEVLTSLEAGFRYGLGGSGGAVVIYTRGRGPDRDPGRNRDP
jgi:hypothetical protein